MCQACVDACREIFPEVPDEDMGNFLLGTTCYPLGGPSQLREQLTENRRQMKTGDWRECYAIADEDLEEAMDKGKPQPQGDRDMSTPISVKPGPDSTLYVEVSDAARRKMREVAGYLITAAIALNPTDPDDALHRLGIALNGYVNSLEKPVAAKPDDKKGK